ncbi:proline--tRNA ligase [Candidatus Woesearchaeota archaeon CG10_big_fil_rev_8_21_14_0_10_37_12]|nr:MAG: proline--tRNA ligase [Candidatus Woesearchaeota archaeon CG10_big_fil_rev_8_21_14_0_10_37_12]
MFLNHTFYSHIMSKESSKKEEQGITVKKSENISEWYTQVIQKAELLEYTDVSGCMIYRPRAYAIWEKIQQFLDGEIKKLGVQNSYFPIFIPEKLLTKEKEHVEGFAPEVAWVTHGGNSKLNERLAVRPTSETIMYDAYAKWIRSHRDLPLKLNQWNNVVRWEFKHPTPFLRGREFLWQEGHTAFAAKQEADKEVLDILELYRQVFEDYLAVPVILGKKTEEEKFAGADYSMSAETLTPSGKAVQACTSHHLGQRFAKSFDIEFLDEKGNKAYPYQNSWGISTRSIGAMIIYHGDDKGLVLPPKVAPLQVVIVPILFDDSKKKVLEESAKLVKQFEKAGISVKLDNREGYTAGWKFNEWELKGVCIRIELGPKDLEKKQAIVVRRDNNKKEAVKLDDIVKFASKELEQMQKDMFEKAKKWMSENTVHVGTVEKLIEAVNQHKMAVIEWDKAKNRIDEIKEKAAGKCLNLPFKEYFMIDKEDKEYAIFAKSY